MSEPMTGGRYNELLRFALDLADNGEPFLEIEKQVLDLNRSFLAPLPETEIHNTVLQLIRKRLIK